MCEFETYMYKCLQSFFLEGGGKRGGDEGAEILGYVDDDDKLEILVLYFDCLNYSYL